MQAKDKAKLIYTRSEKGNNKKRNGLVIDKRGKEKKILILLSQYKRSAKCDKIGWYQ